MKKPYASRKVLAKFTLSEVIAKLLAIGTVNLGRRGIYNDEARQDPFLIRPLTLDQEFDRRLESYDALARHALFSYGVRVYVQEMRLSEIDEQLKSRELSTAWSNRSNSREDKEKALVVAIIASEK